MNVLTFDLGTTLFKVAVFDSTGEVLALTHVSPGVGEGKWTADVNHLMTLLREAARDLARRVGANQWQQVRRISFATQANSLAMHDARGEAITPMYFWPHPGAERDATDLTCDLDADEFFRVTGVPRLSPMMTLARLRWLIRETPGVLRRTHQLCFLSDELTHVFTGQHVTEAGMAALSGLVDIDRCAWWPRAIELAGIPPHILPRIVRAGTNLGPILRDAADAFELPRECEFVVGCLDQYAGAIGTGSTHPGDVCETTGTVLAAVRVSGRRSFRPGVFEGPGPSPGRWWQMTFSSTSANLLEWFRATLPGRPAFDVLSREAADATTAAPIEPFEEGQPIAHCFRHVTPTHTRGQVVRGIFECVAEQLRLQVKALCGDDMPPIIRSAGGGAKSPSWLEIKSRLVGVPFVAVDCPEPTSLGAARLALAASTDA